MDSPVFLDVFDNRLHLQGILTTRTGLHIGAGRAGDPLATDAPVVRDGSGRPFIPGSSLKGVVRSAAEALLRRDPPPEGAERRPQLWSCRHMAGVPCVSDNRVKQLRDGYQGSIKDALEAAKNDKDERTRLLYQAEKQLLVEIWGRSCTVCRLFGSLALASRVRFPDLPLLGDVPPLELRNGVGIDRDRGTAAKGVLYDFEAVPPGACFELNVLLDNFHDAEVGLLLFLFEQLDQGHLALGGKTSRGLGQMALRWQKADETQLRKGNPFADLLSSRNLLHAYSNAPQSTDTESTDTQSTDTERGGTQGTDTERGEPKPADSGPVLPTQGDPELWHEIWRAIEAHAQEHGAFTRDEISSRSGAVGLPNKNEINERLALRLEGRKAKGGRIWEEVLAKLVEKDLLELTHDGQYRLPGTEAPAESIPETEQMSNADGDVSTDDSPVPKPIQPLYDRFVLAMAHEWKEARPCSTTT